MHTNNTRDLLFTKTIHHKGRQFLYEAYDYVL